MRTEQRDQRIRTTITAGRSSPKSPADFDQGPIMVILLTCLAVAMCFTTLGMGFVNLARGNVASKTLGAPLSAPTIQPVKDFASLKIAPALSKSDPVKTEQDPVNEQRERLKQQEQVVEANRQAIIVEQSKAVENAQRLKDLRTEEAQISARIATLRSGVFGKAAEERKRIELRSQLEQELRDLQQRNFATDLRIEELRKTISGAQRAANTNLLIKLGDATWVECSRSGVILLPRGDRVELAELQHGSERFVNAVANRRVQFLVRPDGFESFQAARDAAEQHGVASVGYEPIDASWRIRFLTEGSRP